jgi:hypothetical protein
VEVRGEGKGERVRVKRLGKGVRVKDGKKGRFKSGGQGAKVTDGEKGKVYGWEKGKS